MVVKMDGEVYFNGRQHVEMIGDYKANWDADRLQQLESKMQYLDFYKLPNIFDNPQVTDLPSTYIGYTQGNNLHTVKCRYQTPQNLKDLASWLDQEISKTQWNQINSNNNHE
jgi:virulence-associated protein VapD